MSLILGMCLVGFVSCKMEIKMKELKGSIYIKLVDIGNLQGASKEYKDSLKNEIDFFKKGNSQDQAKADMYEYFDILFKNNLDNKPSFFMQIKGEKNPKRFFTTEKSYERIVDLIKDLDKNSEQINLVIKAEQIESEIYLVKRIKSAKKILGKTNWSK